MKRHVLCTMAGLVMFCPFALANTLFAAVIHVPGDKPTVQSAVDYASDGDQIQIAAGVLSGPGNRDIEFHGKCLLVSGMGTAQTIIDCGGSESENHGAFIFGADDTVISVIGLRVENACFPLSSTDRGAITVLGGYPAIVNCAVDSNNSHGISILGATRPRIISTVISSNSGWGISMPGYPYLSLGVRVSYCQIDHNQLGGMILTRAIESTLVVNNTIADNAGHGLFLQGDLPKGSSALVWDTATLVENNVIAFNSGRGIYFMPFFTGVHYRNNLTYANGSSDVFGLNPDTSCMISADPRFCRQQSVFEYGLSANSPCRAHRNPCGVDIGAYSWVCPSCCVNYRGNIDCDPFNNIDISDLNRFIDYGYISFEPLCCFDAADMDGVGSIDISDLTVLIDYLYISFTPPPQCP